eukprot:1709722-Rhodomonas_salina.3
MHARMKQTEAAEFLLVFACCVANCLHAGRVVDEQPALKALGQLTTHESDHRRQRGARFSSARSVIIEKRPVGQDKAGKGGIIPLELTQHPWDRI